jgi:hypothetical protein
MRNTKYVAFVLLSALWFFFAGPTRASAMSCPTIWNCFDDWWITHQCQEWCDDQYEEPHFSIDCIEDPENPYIPEGYGYIVFTCGLDYPRWGPFDCWD